MQGAIIKRGTTVKYTRYTFFGGPRETLEESGQEDKVAPAECKMLDLKKTYGEMHVQ